MFPMSRLQSLTLLVLLVIVQDTNRPLPMEYLRVGKVLIELNGNTTFEESALLLGAAPIHKTGDAGGFLAWVCYRAVAEGDTAILMLKSSEMGAGKRLTAFSLSRPGDQPNMERDCSELRISPRQIVTDRGGTLGMPRSQLEQVLGSPTEESEDKCVYRLFQDRRGMFGIQRRVMDYTAMSSLELWYQGGRVVRMWGNRIDVN
jgi:hypothetical protein